LGWPVRARSSALKKIPSRQWRDGIFFKHHFK
jgi:hypothetical protein